MLIRFLFVTFLVFLLPHRCVAEPEVSKITTLGQVRIRTIENNPLIRSTIHLLKSAQAAVAQAALLPNPELEIEVEEFGGDFSGFRESESSISIIQPIELGGKRDARTEVAVIEKSAAELEATIIYLESLSQADTAYARVLESQSLLKIVKEQQNLSKKVVENVKKRLTAGAILPAEETKALIRLENDALAYDTAQTDLLLAKQGLATLWGGSADEIGVIQDTVKLGELSSYLKAYDLTDSPFYKLQKIRQDIATERTKLAQSLAVPDLNVGLGYKRIESTDEDTFLGSVSIGLPIFNRNQGGIAASKQQEHIAALMGRNNTAELANRFATQQIKLRRLIHEHKLLKERIIPSSAKAFQQASDSYSRGRTSYLELLDAQQTLVESKKRKVELVFEVTEAISLIDKLMGTRAPQNLEDNNND